MKMGELRATSATLALFSFTLFLSAALMFALQPMVGKMLLPLVGGTPAGWIVALAFFQVMLLIGYLLAWLFSRLNVFWHGVSYIGFLAIGALLLPLVLDRSLVTVTPGPGDIFILLTLLVGLPFVALSATSSTLQRMFTATDHAGAHDPYFLYAASNLGSFLGLFLYPLFIEPQFTISQQSLYWAYIYIFLMAAGIACLLFVKPAPKLKVAAPPPCSWEQRAMWAALAFVPSSLLLGVTTHITTDVFSAPMIWVIPLGIYLLTFVVAFSKNPALSYEGILKIHPSAVAGAVILASMGVGEGKTSLYGMMLHVAAFAVVACMCHMRLARSRPLGDSRQLTEFYLMISIGGALGGLLNAFVAPAVFTTQIEYPLMMIASCLLHPGLRSKYSGNNRYLLMTGGVMILLSAVLGNLDAGPAALRVILLFGGFSMLLIHPRVAMTGCAVILVAISAYAAIKKPVVLTRNFYGIIKVQDRQEKYRGAVHQLRVMSHGTTIHGTQIREAGLETAMTTYYSSSGPLGNIFSLYKPQNIAVMGLGAGTINCYGTPQNAFTFFEINQAVVDMAKAHFSYLEKCKARRPARIILGDARLEFARQGDKEFDLIILDVFSSDMIPTHLLTREAMQLYMEHLAPGGLMVFHTSNRYFNFEEVIAATAGPLGLENRYAFDSAAKDPHASSSKWMALSRQDASLSPLDGLGWTRIIAPENTRPWSDDYTSFLDVIKF